LEACIGGVLSIVDVATVFPDCLNYYRYYWTGIRRGGGDEVVRTLG